MVKKLQVLAPEGGYGWVIVCAAALNNFVLIPLMQSFGLIFKDTFADLGFTASQGSLIINLNAAFGMLTGLFNGTLIKYYGYRKVSFLGAALNSVGIFLTSFSHSFLSFMISYGIIASLGFGLASSSYNYAVNVYFKTDKSKAIGIMMTLTGLGPIIMPQIINILIENFDTSGVTLILSALCCHSFVAASLLQPVKWHMRKVWIDEEEVNKDVILEENEEQVEDEEINKNVPLIRQTSRIENQQRSRKNSEYSIVYEQEAAGVLGTDSTFGGSVLSLNNVAQLTERHPSVTKIQWWKSKSTINLESSVNIFNEKNKPSDGNIGYSEEPEKQKPRWKIILHRISVMFDLNLLKDPIYLNIMIGMSLAIFAEMNFSVLTAFILDDIGLSTSEIATFMSILGIADIIFRFLAPYISDIVNQPPRVMYMVVLLCLITTRFGLILDGGIIYFYLVGGALGIAKGVRTVYMSLVIPTYVPIEKLPSASGIQMMVNGACILIGGPVLGVIRDITGTYTECIIIMNCVTFTTFTMWSLELLYKNCLAKKDCKEEDVEKN